jgi:hypothetical protein
MVDIPIGVYTSLGFVNSAAFIGKGIQSFAEKPDVNTTTSVETTVKSTTGDIDETRTI